MSTMKRKLVAAAKRAFKQNEEEGSTWWGLPSVTEEDEWEYMKYSLLTLNPEIGFSQDGDYSIWFLLIGAHFSEDDK